MTSHIVRSRTLLLSAAALLSGAMSLNAQVPSASAAAFGMGGNFTAAAEGFNAIAWNPAALGLSAPKFSLSLLSTSGFSGLTPVSLSNISAFQGVTIPAATKEAWLQAIGTGIEKGGAEGGISLVALSAGRLGFQLGVSGTGSVNLNQDAAEAILFGNAGRTGTARSMSFAGSNAQGSSFATGAVSIGLPIRQNEAGDVLALGVTGKLIKGIAAGRVMDNGSVVGTSNIDVRFPAIYTDESRVGDAGSGFGVDLGLSWRHENTTASATVRNVVNTFAWNPAAMVSRAGTFTFDGTTSSTSFDVAPYVKAPAGMRASFEAEKLQPEIALGVSRKLASFTVAADARNRFADGIEIGPKMHVGAGAEYTGLSVLRIRGGAAVVSDGFQIAGGLGLRLGRLEIGAGVSSRSRNGGQETGAMLSLITIQ